MSKYQRSEFERPLFRIVLKSDDSSKYQSINQSWSKVRLWFFLRVGGETEITEKWKRTIIITQSVLMFGETVFDLLGSMSDEKNPGIDRCPGHVNRIPELIENYWTL